MVADEKPFCASFALIPSGPNPCAFRRSIWSAAKREASHRADDGFLREAFREELGAEFLLAVITPSEQAIGVVEGGNW